MAAFASKRATERVAALAQGQRGSSVHLVLLTGDALTDYINEELARGACVGGLPLLIALATAEGSVAASRH